MNPTLSPIIWAQPAGDIAQQLLGHTPPVGLGVGSIAPPGYRRKLHNGAGTASPSSVGPCGCALGGGTSLAGEQRCPAVWPWMSG